MASKRKFKSIESHKKQLDGFNHYKTELLSAIAKRASMRGKEARRAAKVKVSLSPVKFSGKD